MQYELNNNEGMHLLRVNLAHGEKLKMSIASLVCMSGGSQITSALEGNFLSNLVKMIKDDTFFYQYIVAAEDDCDILLGNPRPGPVLPLRLDGSYDMCITKNAFVAAANGVGIETTIRPAVRGRKELKYVLATGKGLLFLGGYGGICPIKLKRDQKYIVDVGNVIGWTDNIRVKVDVSNSGWMNSKKGVTAIVATFTGPGFILVQSKSEQNYKHWMTTLEYLDAADVEELINTRVSAMLPDILKEVHEKVSTEVKTKVTESAEEKEMKEYKKSFDELSKTKQTELKQLIKEAMGLKGVQQQKMMKEISEKGYHMNAMLYAQYILEKQ